MKILLYCKHSYSFGILRPLELAARRAGHELLWYVDPDIYGKFPFCASSTATGSLAEAHAWHPDAVFVPGNAVPPTLRGVKVQVFHGFNVQKRDSARGHFRVRGLFDLYCTQGPATTTPFRELAAREGHFAVAGHAFGVGAIQRQAGEELGGHAPALAGVVRAARRARGPGGG